MVTSPVSSIAIMTDTTSYASVKDAAMINGSLRFVILLMTLSSGRKTRRNHIYFFQIWFQINEV